MFALLAVWMALGAFLTSLALALSHSAQKEAVTTLLPYTIAFSATLAAGVLWGFRKKKPGEPGVAGQRLQAVVAVVFDSLAFAVMLIWLHGLVDAALGLLLEGAFLCFVYWLYTRVLVPDRMSNEELRVKK